MEYVFPQKNGDFNKVRDQVGYIDFNMLILSIFPTILTEDDLIHEIDRNGEESELKFVEYQHKDKPISVSLEVTTDYLASRLEFIANINLNGEEERKILCSLDHFINNFDTTMVDTFNDSIRQLSNNLNKMKEEK